MKKNSILIILIAIILFILYGVIQLFRSIPNTSAPKESAKLLYYYAIQDTTTKPLKNKLVLLTEKSSNNPQSITGKEIKYQQINPLNGETIFDTLLLGDQLFEHNQHLLWTLGSGMGLVAYDAFTGKELTNTGEMKAQFPGIENWYQVKTYEDSMFFLLTDKTKIIFNIKDVPQLQKQTNNFQFTPNDTTTIIKASFINDKNNTQYLSIANKTISELPLYNPVFIEDHINKNVIFAPKTQSFLIANQKENKREGFEYISIQANGKINWRKPSSEYVSISDIKEHFLLDNTLYIIKKNSKGYKLFAIDFLTGEIIWEI